MNNHITRTLARIRQDRVIINPLLTMQCNFRCDHCFYDSGPDSPNLFMSEEILDDITRQIRELNEWGIKPTLNLIGGEPTLNLKKFDRYLYWATWLHESELVSAVEMTTNGWWLKELRWVRRFMEVISNNVPHHMFGLEGGFTCRISNDPFHDKYHPAWLVRNGSGLPTGILEQIWEGYSDVYDEPVFYPQSGYECQDCNHYVDEIPEDEACPECNDDPEWDDSYWSPMYDSEVDFNIPPNPELQEDGRWLYVEHYSKGMSTVIPTSRTGIGQNDSSSRHCAGDILSYKPTGWLNDICCKGSDAPFGTTKDHPLVLLALADKYIQEVRPTCYACKEQSQQWVTFGVMDWKPVFEKELEELTDYCYDNDIDTSDQWSEEMEDMLDGQGPY